MNADEKTRSEFFDRLKIGDSFTIADSDFEVVKIFNALTNKPDAVRARRKSDGKLIDIGWEDYVYQRAI